jgi:2-keto-4-pentenoate hydratase
MDERGQNWATQVAELLDQARRHRQTLDAGQTLGPLTMTEAYAAQRALTGRRLARGEKVIGWKLGYTSAAMRAQMGVDQPNFGPLTDAMLLPSGAAVADDLVQPRVEPEIALRFARPLSALDGPVGRDDVLAAVDVALAALEVVHSTWTDYRFTVEHNTADGSSAAQVVLGGVLETEALDAVEVDLELDGVPTGHGRGSDASGHPADGVCWLLDQLALDGRGLEAGDVVITGGLTRAAPLAPGGRILARFTGGGMPSPVEVAVRRVGGPRRPSPGRG